MSTNTLHKMMTTLQSAIVLFIVLGCCSNGCSRHNYVAASSIPSMSTTTKNTIISTADSRLPMSLSTVITDLEAEGCCTELSTVCLVVSKSVTKMKRKLLIESLLGIPKGDSSDDSDAVVDDDEDDDTMMSSSTDADTWKAIAISNGLILGQPNSIGEVVSTTIVCNGILLYYADPIDFIRNENLFNNLIPAVEAIIAINSNQKTTFEGVSGAQLYIIGNEEMMKEKFEAAATVHLSKLVCNGGGDGNGKKVQKQIMTLQDVFNKIVYVTPENAIQVISDSIRHKTTPSAVSSLVASTVSFSTGSSGTISTIASASTSSSSLLISGGGGGGYVAAAAAAFASINAIPTTGPSSPQILELLPNNIAAARTLGPKSRGIIKNCIQTVTDACMDRDEGSDGTTMILVSKFGELCDAAVTVALNELEGPEPDNILQSTIGKQIRYMFIHNIDLELFKLFDKQLVLLSDSVFDEFKKKLSKLLISPNLASDMNAVIMSSLQQFQASSKQLIPTKYNFNSWYSAIGTYKISLKRQLQQYVANRLLTAKASGQYKPLPRKGITIGLHWLLPKPFGNDYRQEPWMVHATDNMVYVPPQKKISDVNPEDIASGDWRSKIIPNPAGNDMLYMQ